VKLLIQPGDGVTPLVKGINSAKKSVEIAIFRFDRQEIERALENAVARGVFVHALIAYTNRGGEKSLRELEANLLAAGITVARTAGDLLRYHYKFMIIDRRTLYLLTFNYTYLDIEHSRSFGIITKNSSFVQEAVRLFEADTKRQPYTPDLEAFVVSPTNARKQLPRFIKGAKKQLLIYDPKISDAAMLRLLEERARAGVEIRVIGHSGKKGFGLDTRRVTRTRLHTRTIIRDRHKAFVGSQSLRQVELDKRRELGLIVRDAKVVKALLKTFESDWRSLKPTEEHADKNGRRSRQPAKTAKKIERVIAKELPLAPVVRHAVKQVAGETAEVKLKSKEVEETVEDAVKEGIKDALKHVVKEAVERKTGEQ